MKYTIKLFQEEFPDDDVCLEYIFNQRFGAEFECPRCQRVGSFYRVRKRKTYACLCGYQVSPTAGTIFHKSATKLTLWFFAIYLFSQSKNGVSAKELERQLGVTYKCAWRIGKHIRTLMDSDPGLLSGTVEMDETYVGGRGRNNRRGRGSENKTPVFGMVERNGRVRAMIVPNAQASTLMPLIRDNVQIGSNINTDEFYSYNHVRDYGYHHEKVRHTSKEYVRGDVHTNTIEGYWSQLKRSIHGTYHAVSPKYLQSYVDEFSFRYNARSSPQHVFDLLMERI